MVVACLGCTSQAFWFWLNDVFCLLRFLVGLGIWLHQAEVLSWIGFTISWVSDQLFAYMIRFHL
jgi:hypothetical protein